MAKKPKNRPVQYEKKLTIPGEINFDDLIKMSLKAKKEPVKDKK